MLRVRLFVDFWNFQLNWQKRAEGQVDWKRVPIALRDAAAEALATSGLGDLQLEETRVYASYEPDRENKLRGWLHNFLDKQPGVRVFTVERHWRQRKIHCRFCNTDHHDCPTCDQPLGRAAEKTIDAAIVTDMLSLAWEDAYEVALLVSSDRDYIPAVECLQSKNFKVVNATWKGHGHALARISWASFYLDSLLTSLRRS